MSAAAGNRIRWKVVVVIIFGAPTTLQGCGIQFSYWYDYERGALLEKLESLS